ncbi:MAG: hypothetical protein FWF80_00165 [Defluviitaleaceae bacterium]|nr:hypothetical protein [Defluviitaleaceae bacterium]
MYTNRRIAISAIVFVVLMTAGVFAFPTRTSANIVTTPPPTTFDEAWRFNNAMDIFSPSFSQTNRRHYYRLNVAAPGEFQLILNAQAEAPVHIFIYNSNRAFRLETLRIVRRSHDYENMPDRTFHLPTGAFYIVVYNEVRPGYYGLTTPYQAQLKK